MYLLVNHYRKENMEDELDLQSIEQMSPMEMAERYHHILELKDKVEAAYKLLRANLLEVTKKNKVLSLKTETYTISRVQRNTVKVTNDKVAIKSLEMLNVPVETKVVLDMDYMKEPLKQLIDRGEQIDGVESFATEYVQVRKNKK